MIRQFRQFEKSYDDFNYFMMNHVKNAHFARFSFLMKIYLFQWIAMPPCYSHHSQIFYRKLRRKRRENRSPVLLPTHFTRRVGRRLRATQTLEFQRNFERSTRPIFRSSSARLSRIFSFTFGRNA